MRGGQHLLDDLDAEEEGASVGVAHVDVERADGADGEAARPMASGHVQQADAQQLVLVQARPMERQVAAGQQVQVRRLRARVRERRRETALRHLRRKSQFLADDPSFKKKILPSHSFSCCSVLRFGVGRNPSRRMVPNALWVVTPSVKWFPIPCGS